MLWTSSQRGGGTGDKVVVATCKKAKAKREKTDGFPPKQEGGK